MTVAVGVRVHWSALKMLGLSQVNVATSMTTDVRLIQFRMQLLAQQAFVNYE